MSNYTYPGTLTVKNKFGVTSQDELERIEAPFLEARQAEIALGYGPPGQFDAAHLRALHRHLFQDVYEWAGRTRDEPTRLSDGTIASETVLRKVNGKDFLDGPSILGALHSLAYRLQQAGHLRNLPREEFATRAADVMAELNAIHPFREGNGRVQRLFVQRLAEQAGHQLDFTVVTKERMIRASIAAHEQNDLSQIRRMFVEISDSSRVGALREAIEFIEGRGFTANNHYIATTEPGHRVELVMAGVAGEHFMARTKSEILIGNTSDLPSPHPQTGETFVVHPAPMCAEIKRDN